MPTLVAKRRAAQVPCGGREQVLALQQEQQRIFSKEQLIVIFTLLKRLVGPPVKVLRARFLHWTQPLRSSLLLQTLADLGTSKSELVAENALLREQLIILKRQVKGQHAPRRGIASSFYSRARAVRAWKQTHITRSARDEARGFHRELFRSYWKSKSKAHAHKPKVATETIAWIREMAKENRRLQC